MRTLLFALLLMLIMCPAFADSNRSASLIDVLKSPQFTIQFATDGRKRIVGGVTVTPLGNSISNETVTLIKDGDKEFVGIKKNNSNTTKCYLRDKEWCYEYIVSDGVFSVLNQAKTWGKSYPPNTIERKEPLLVDARPYGEFKERYQPFTDYYNDLLQYIGVINKCVDYTKPAEPIRLKGNYHSSGQETINDITYEYDEYWDDSTPKFVAKNRYYYKDGKFNRFVSLGDGFEIEYWKYVNLFVYPGRISAVNFNEPKSMTNVVSITQFTNSVAPGALDFPANVKFEDILIAKLLPVIKRDRKRYENRNLILIADKQRRGERQEKLLQAIKDVLQ